MIVTDLDHSDGQLIAAPILQQALSFLRRIGESDLPAGRIAIDGDRLYATVQIYDTTVTDRPNLEAHRIYTDLQYLVSGEEVVAWIPLARMTITQPYEEAKDICYGTAPGREITPVFLRAGQLIVLFPEDGHAPKLAADRPSPVRKIVVKAALRP